MAINPEDVKLYESQVLSDEADGGGRATGVEIVDGQVNNLFPDISRLDRTLGDVALRKAFLGIDTDNQDVYLGAHAIIVEPPVDPNVSVLMFDAGSENDERTDAQNRIESYVVQGAAAQFDLLGNQYEGQRSLVCIQREEQPVPEVGDVYLIHNTANDDKQYIRVTEVDSQIQTFTALVNSTPVDFQRRRIDIGISATLEHTFPGGEPRLDGPSTPHSDIFTTEVADAARYWGVTKAAAQVGPGDLAVEVDSLYASLVPSAQAESAIADAPFYQAPTDVREAAAGTLTDTFKLAYPTPTTVIGYLSRPAVRGTVSLSIFGNTYSDNGGGLLTRVSGAAPISELRINYATGAIEGQRDTGTGDDTLTGTATYLPGAPFSGRRLSDSLPIDINNRGFTYLQTWPQEKPRPGTLVISYRALGKWYTIRETGSGALEGYGAGALNFTTGTLSVTLDVMPDVGSRLIFEYVMDLADESEERSGTQSRNAAITVSAEEGLDPGTVVVTYTAGGTDYTLTDVATHGELAGDGSGTVDYANGTVTFEPDLVPDDGTSIAMTYDKLGADTFSDTSPTVSNGSYVVTIPNAPLKPGSVSLTLTTRREYGGARDVVNFSTWVASDDGNGNIGPGGTINYTTGAVSLPVEGSYSSSSYRTSSYYDPSTQQRVYERELVTSGRSDELSGAVQIKYTQAGASAAAGSVSAPFSSVRFQLLDDFDTLIPGSLLFDWGGQRYLDRDGLIYTDFDSATGAATAVGSINYQAAEITLDAWPEGAAPGLTIVAAATTGADVFTDRVAFRTGGAPLRPQSFTVTVTDTDGNAISETAALDGTVTGASVDGTVNVETGVVDLVFKDSNDDPVWVAPETGRYNAVVLSFLPLDAELIGLDPVRLPADGKVPVFREGDVVVLSHTAETDIGTPTAGSTETLARDHLAAIEVVDSAGVALDPAMYTANLLAGTVTFADPLTLQDAALNALTAPLTIRDRIEHMSVINDIDIGGSLSFIAPVAHTFPANETVVSSAKVWGDINARVFNFFTQRTWNSGDPNWTDDRIGDDTTANYNIVDNPVEFANNGAITEKWALVFTSSTSFNIVGQTLGVIGTGNTSTDAAPQNPNTGNPYFVMRAAGFGGGWSAGNVIRFDTEGCLAPVWIARTVLSGGSTQDDDQFVLQVRGDAD
jgi:hypothetical protein